MSHVDAYEQGCVIHVKTVITKHPDASREEWFELLRRLDLHDLAGGRHRSLEFARLYVYGTEHLEPPGEDGGFEEERELEVFTRINAIGTGRALASIEESLLVTPSPPGRAMTVVADWPDADVPRGSLTIGMDAIRAATRQAIVL